MSSVSSAQSRIPFAARQPKDLSQPQGIFINPTTVAPVLQALALVYNSPVYGLVDVVEQAPDVPDPVQRLAGYQYAVAQNGQSGVSGTAEVVNLPDGTPALITTTQDGTRSDISWVWNEKLQITIQGPQLTRDKVIQLANQF
jgi:hypothetical protein